MNPTETRERIAAEVRAGMARKNIKRADLAAQLDMDPRTLSARLNGRVAFNTDELLIVSQVTGIAFSMLFPEEEDVA